MARDGLPSSLGIEFWLDGCCSTKRLGPLSLDRKRGDQDGLQEMRQRAVGSFTLGRRGTLLHKLGLAPVAVAHGDVGRGDMNLGDDARANKICCFCLGLRTWSRESGERRPCQGFFVSL